MSLPTEVGARRFPHTGSAFCGACFILYSCSYMSDIVWAVTALLNRDGWEVWATVDF